MQWHRTLKQQTNKHQVSQTIQVPDRTFKSLCSWPTYIWNVHISSQSQMFALVYFLMEGQRFASACISVSILLQEHCHQQCKPDDISLVPLGSFCADSPYIPVLWSPWCRAQQPKACRTSSFLLQDGALLSFGNASASPVLLWPPCLASTIFHYTP